MSFKVHLELMRAPLVADDFDSGNEEESCSLTSSKAGPRLSDLMLFDHSSLTTATRDGETWVDLMTDRLSAAERFHRRLPLVLPAVDWNPLAAATLTRFGQFFRDIDWPYVRLETLEYRNFANIDVEAFDADLAFAVQALDQPPIAAPGRLFR